MIEIQENGVIEVLAPKDINRPEYIGGRHHDAKIKHLDPKEYEDLISKVLYIRNRVNELFLILDNTPSSIHLKYETQRYLAEISKELTDMIKECK